MAVKKILINFLVIFLAIVISLKVGENMGLTKGTTKQSKNPDCVEETVKLTERKITILEETKPLENVDNYRKEETTDNKETVVDVDEIIAKIYDLLDNNLIKSAKNVYNINKVYKLPKEIEDDINKKERTLVDEAINKAKEQYFTSSLKDAIQEITTCRKIVGDDNEKLNSFYNLLDGCKEISLTSLEPFDQEEMSLGIHKDKIIDSYSNEYDMGFVFYADPYAYSPIFLSYVIPEGVDTFKAIIAPSSDLFVSSREYHIYITAKDKDGNIVMNYTSDPLTKYSYPSDVELDIPENASLFFIQCTNGSVGSGPLGSALVANPIFTKRLTDEDFIEAEIL